MLADPTTIQIHAILDWEFTHAMPAQFSSDPLSCLILKGPDIWLENHTMDEFLARYQPRWKQFLAALEKVEARLLPMAPVLWTQMRGSWTSGRFGCDYGIRKSMDADEIYWGALHWAGDDVLDEEKHRLWGQFVERKMGDLKAYDEECRERGL